MGNDASKPTAKLDRLVGEKQYSVKFEQQTFAHGACRYAFRGVYKGKGPLDGKKCVTKVFIDGTRHNENYEPDVKASQKAYEFAKAFNAAYASSKPLRFLVPELATVTTVPEGAGYAEPMDKILVEDFIEGHYEKFNSNGGWQSEEVAAIPTFSHFTYWKSNGQFLVCDIQGVRTPTGYTLTDPAVLSRQAGQFGPTDIGPSGMSKFFKSHKCTSVCSQFPLPVFSNSRKINRGRVDRRESTYTFMLDAKQQEANKYFKERNDLPAIKEE